MKRMNAKYPGTCCQCNKPILPGNPILFFGRGRAAHADCTFAKLPAAERHPVRRDNSSAEDSCCGDMAYEDSCERACGY